MSYNNVIKRALETNKFSLNEGQISKISEFINLLIGWNQKINLTAHRELEDILYKDIIDSLYLSSHITKHDPEVRSILDMGSGAGFSGLIIGLMNPNLKVGFLDSNRKKINFVKQACREMDLSQAYFLKHRAEETPEEWKEAFHAAVSRATWSQEDFLRYARYYVQNNGYAFLMSGKKKNHQPESQDLQGFKRGKEFFYKIAPKNYERLILSFEKV